MLFAAALRFYFGSRGLGCFAGSPQSRGAFGVFLASQRYKPTLRAALALRGMDQKLFYALIFLSLFSQVSSTSQTSIASEGKREKRLIDFKRGGGGPGRRRRASCGLRGRKSNGGALFRLGAGARGEGVQRPSRGALHRVLSGYEG